MTDFGKKIFELKNDLNSFYLFATTYIGDQEIADNLRSKFDEITETAEPMKSLDDFYEILEIICLVISEKEGASEDISNTHIFRSTQIGEIFKKLDLISHEYYQYCKTKQSLQPSFEQGIRSTDEPEKIYEHLGIQTNIFESIDPSFLLPTENLVGEPPVGAKVVTLDVKNTQNLVVTIKNIVDSEYVKAKFPNITTKSGVNSEMIQRYNIMRHYPKPKELEEPEIITKTEKVYQKLAEGVYRELSQYPKLDYVRNSEYVPINNFVTNYENKRIMLMRQSTPTQEPSVDLMLPGIIKQKFVMEKNKLDDAIFWSLYKDEMSDDEVLRLGLSAHIIQDNLPKNTKIIESKFDSFINRQTLKKLF